MNNKDIKISNSANLPTKYGEFTIKSYKEGTQEHLVIYSKDFEEIEIPLIRVHSECLTGDTFGSLKCDCGEQLDYALEMIALKGGMVIYHRQEGRNIGLFNKVNAYALQDKGYNTVEAIHQLGFETDMRTYDVVDVIMQDFGKKKIKLLTNNPKKISSIKYTEVIEMVPIKMETNSYNEEYLKVKKEQMGHLL